MATQSLAHQLELSEWQVKIKDRTRPNHQHEADPQWHKRAGPAPPGQCTERFLQHSDCCLTRSKFLLIPASGGNAGLHPLCAAIERSDEISSVEKPANLLHLKCLGCRPQKNQGVFKRSKAVTSLELSAALCDNFPTTDTSTILELVPSPQTTFL